MPQTPREVYDALTGKCLELCWTPGGPVEIRTKLAVNKNCDCGQPDCHGVGIPILAVWFYRATHDLIMGQTFGCN